MNPSLHGEIEIVKTGGKIKNMNRLIYLKDVVTLALDETRCTGCGMCTRVCPHGVLAMNRRHVRIVHRDACMECGACSKNCPADAIAVDVGVGCAAAVINAALGREGTSCCCVADNGCC